MTKAQRDAEEQARQDELEGRVEALVAQGAKNWVWPGSGEEDDSLPRNCFFTGLPVREKQHKNAYKTRWAQPPGCANKRHKKRLHALSGSGARE